MTKSRVKIAIFGLIAWALVLTLFLVSGLKAPASAETLTNNGNETIFARPDDVTTDFAKHTFGDGETKNAMYIKFGNLTIGDETWSPYVNATFASLTLKIEWAGSEAEYPRTDGKIHYGTFEGTWKEFAAAPGFANSDDENTTNNAKYLDLVSETSGYTLYFAPGTDTFSLFASSYASGNDSNNLFYHVDATEDWYLTLTVTYNNDGWVYTDDTPTAPTVTFTRIKFNMSNVISEFDLSETERAYKAGYDAGYTSGKAAGLAEGNRLGYDQGYDAGLAEGKKTAYDEGYAAGLAAAKAETKPDAEQDNKPNVEPDNKSDQKPSGSTTTTDKPSSSKFTSWLEENKVILIVVGLMLVGVVVLVLLCKPSSPRRRR